MPVECVETGGKLPKSYPPALTIYTIFRIYASMKIQGEDMLTAADEACGLLKALANRHRLMVVCQLIEKERSVGELADLLNIRDLDCVPASGPVAQGRACEGAARWTDHLVFDWQRPGERIGSCPLSGLLRASSCERSEATTQTGATTAPCAKSMTGATAHAR